MGHNLKKLMGPALGIALAIMVGPNSKADITTDDTSLTNPPGVYFGSGNANSNFTTVTDGTTELGLSVIQRYVSPIDPGAGSNVYQVSSGVTTVPTKTGSSWGFDFSINTQYNTTTDVLDDYTYSMQITDVTTSNTGPSFDPTLIPDDSGFGSSGKTAGVDATAEWGAQNSESLSFAGFLPGYNVNANDEYEITLSATSKATGLTETDTVFANATPEPMSILLLGTLALGVFVLGSRRLSDAKPTL